MIFDCGFHEVDRRYHDLWCTWVYDLELAVASLLRNGDRRMRLDGHQSTKGVSGAWP